MKMKNQRRRICLTENQLRLMIQLIKENQKKIDEDLNEDNLTEIEKEEEQEKLGFWGKTLRAATGVNYRGQEHNYPEFTI
jgi:hypothetical protein